jgi:hypothetical protein
MFGFVRGDHVKEWSSKNDGMIYVICNNKEIFKIKTIVENGCLCFFLKDEVWNCLLQKVFQKYFKEII